VNIKIYSRRTLEKFIQNHSCDGLAIISFYDPDIEPIDFLGKGERVFQIPVYDIDMDELKEYNLTYDTYFPEANELAKFIYRAKEDGLDIICQCEYGQSRSAGCAAAICEHFYSKGITIFSHFKYYPNKMVYHKLMYSLEQYKTDK